ncbi:hypothetical protein [Microbispora sp. NBRC 16548]|uniref:hypothetical protein n=1 Tax=Microbispora sp. NBRC 16548 TaxID=3030994 RepID=UPI0016208C45|nr:hypothetical protein [Microbispora sp. NBRC 16548]GLX05993.1 hypothetical protein Misp03_29200 [Microbispora sp. NBRC 16548]
MTVDDCAPRPADRVRRGEVCSPRPRSYRGPAAFGKAFPPDKDRITKAAEKKAQLTRTANG